MERTKKYLKQETSKTVSLTPKTNGAQSTSTWDSESKDPIKDTGKVNAFGKTTCMKAGGSETKESAKEEK